MSSLLNVLRGVNIISNLNEGLDPSKIQVAIGNFGGRKFYMNSDERVSLNQIVQRLADTPRTDDYDYKQVRSIINKIKQLDAKGEAALANSSTFVKVATWIKSFFSSLFFDRTSILSKITKEADAVLANADRLAAEKQAQEKAKAEIEAAEKAASEKRKAVEEPANAMALTDLVKVVRFSPQQLLLTGGEGAEPFEYKETYENTVQRDVLIRRTHGLLVKDQPSLRAQFEALKGEPEAFKNLAIAAASAALIPAFTSHFLETLEWPTEELKEDLMPHLCAIMLERSRAIQVMTAHVPLDTEFMTQNTLKTNQVLILGRSILGANDFSKTELPEFLPNGQISSYLAAAIGKELRKLGNYAVADLQNKIADQSHSKMAIGLHVVLCQSWESRFPATVFAPLLPHFKGVPGLLSLDLFDLGTTPSGPSDYEGMRAVVKDEDEKTREVVEQVINNFKEKEGMGTGFKDESAEDLLDIVRTNPYMMLFKPNFSGMSPERKETFVAEWGTILASRGTQVSGKERLLIDNGQKA